MKRTYALSLALGALALAGSGACSLAAATPARKGPPARAWSVTLAPDPADFAVAVVRFPARGRPALSARTLRAAVPGAFGADYLAVAALRRRAHGSRIALVLLVNRPTPLLDPASVRVRLRSARALGAPDALVESNPFDRPVQPATGSPPAVTRTWPCALSSPAILDASALVPISSRGAPVAGFTLTGAVAAAYDWACDLAEPPAFEQAVHPAPAPPECRPATLCCPPNAMCVPPKEPLPPGCPVCDPLPGHVCPLAPSAYVCVEHAAGSATRAGASRGR